MDQARIKALAVLGYNFGFHLLRSLLPREKGDQAELFQSYFREDRIVPLTPAEAEEIFSFENCIGCGLCEAHCRVAEISGGRFRGPMHLALAASRSQPDFLHDVDNFTLCALCGQCEPVCPEHVPVARMALAMRRMMWRTTPEALPRAWQDARQNWERFGNISGPNPALDLPACSHAPHLLLLGPSLPHHPERATRIFRLLEQLGYEMGVLEEESDPRAAELGLEAPEKEKQKAIFAGGSLVIVADPELFVSLVPEEETKAGQVRFLLEVVAERWPEGKRVEAGITAPAAFHEGPGLGRQGRLGKAVREFLKRLGIPLVELEREGEFPPPLGWEGGIEFTDPELATALARARLKDAASAGAATLLTISPRDIALLEKCEKWADVSVVYLFDLLESILTKGGKE